MKLFKSIIVFLFFANTFAQTPTLTLLKGKIASQIKELNDVMWLICVRNQQRQQTTTGTFQCL